MVNFYNSVYILKEWSRVYGRKELSAYSCYSLDNTPVLEKKLVNLKQDMGIDSYLTGGAGGVRYAPVVRYNKGHVYIASEDIQEAIRFLEIKEVDNSANVIIFPQENESYIKDSRVIQGDVVVSPEQIYLDSMQLKGHSEEMENAVLQKEIIDG